MDPFRIATNGTDECLEHKTEITILIVLLALASALLLGIVITMSLLLRKSCCKSRTKKHTYERVVNPVAQATRLMAE